jgi:hypothetical protein
MSGYARVCRDFEMLIWLRMDFQFVREYELLGFAEAMRIEKE